MIKSIQPLFIHPVLGILNCFRTATTMLLVLLLITFTASAYILDDFNSASLSDWTTTANGGTVVQSGGQLTITPVAFSQALTYSRKTSQTFTPAANHTLEFRVQVNSILTNAVTTNGTAVLGWVPVGGALGANGYAVGIGYNTIAMLANSSFVFVTNLSAGAYSLPVSNMFLVLRLTPDGSSMVVRATVYNKTDTRFNILFEHTITNSSTALVGTNGNVVLGAFNDTTGSATQAVFDNLQYFDTTRQVLDDFSGPYPAGWQDHVSGIATNFNNGNGQLEMQAGIGNNQVSGTFKADNTFTITDGVRIELRVDAVNIAGDPGNFTILAYAPHGDADFTALTSYHLSFSAAQVYVGKAYGNWWDEAYTLAAPQSDIRLIQTLTGEGTGVRIETRLEDLSKDVNDPARVVYEITRLDTSGAYQNFNGYFQLGNFHAGGGQSVITWDNAEVNTTSAGNTPPVLTGITPADGKNFYDAAGGVSFTVKDDVNTPLNNIKLILNGVSYTNGSPGVLITPPDASSLSRSFTFTGLTANVFYLGSIQAIDNLGAITAIPYEFDTFLTNNLQVESEDFNYSDNPGTDGGKFLDGLVWGYLNKQGTAEVDYHDSRTSGNSDDPAHYRDSDFPRTYATSDGPRSFLYNGGPVELLTYDNENGDWRNYTRTYPTGTFNVFSRQSTFALPIGLVTLEKVTSDPTTNDQTSYVLGSFQQLGDIAGNTGYDRHRDVPLTDAAGNRLVIRLAGGVETLRIRDVYVNDRNNADVFHNYFVFVPVTDPGTLRPVVSMTSPQAGTTSRISNQSEETFAEIANRDTTVDTNTITMTINGSPATITITNTTGGARVYWSFAALTPAPSYTHALSFTDSDGTNQVFNWTYSYPFLRASNSLPLNSLSARGFHYRTVQSDNGGVTLGSSLARAEQQLAVPPTIPVDISVEGDMNDTLVWSNDNFIPKDVPGLTNAVALNNIASEALGYMEILTAGPYRFRVSSDDGWQLRSGVNPKDVNAKVLGQQDGSTFSGTFDFVVEAPGLYPIRNLWYENGGGANFSLGSVNLSDNSTVSLNDTNDPPNVIKVYNAVYTVGLLSSATLGGPYDPEPSAVVDNSARTVTVATSGAVRFYKLTTISGAQLRIESIALSGGNVVLRYKFQ